MRSETFQLTVPSNLGVKPVYLDVSTVGTGLAGLAQDAPLVVNPKQDVQVVGGQGGDGVVTVRASAPDMLRFAVRGATPLVPFDVLVTEL